MYYVANKSAHNDAEEGIEISRGLQSDESDNYGNNSKNIQNDNDQVIHEMSPNTTNTVFSSRHAALNERDDDTKSMFRTMRRLTFWVLLGASIVATSLMFWYARQDQIKDFEQAFDRDAQTFLGSFRNNVVEHFDALESFSESITQFVANLKRLDKQQNWSLNQIDNKKSNSTLNFPTDFPFVTLPEFERRAAYPLESAQLMRIMFHPLVKTEQQSTWEAYSVQNQGWFTESLQFQESASGIPETKGESIAAKEISSAITPAGRSGPHFPLWQMAPISDKFSLVNFDVYTVAKEEIDFVRVMKRPVLSRTLQIGTSPELFAGDSEVSLEFLLQELLGEAADKENLNSNETGGPYSFIYLPVFDTDRIEVVGVLVGLMSWRTYLENLVIISESENEISETAMIAILHSTCEDTYSFEIQGPVTSFVFNGDAYGGKYDQTLTREAELSTVWSILKGDAGNDKCLYKLRLHPSSEMRDLYITDEPYYLAAIIFLAFLSTAFVLLCCDYIIQWKQRSVTSMVPRQQRSVAPKTVAQKTKSPHSYPSSIDEKDTSESSPASTKMEPESDTSYERSNYEGLTASLTNSNPVANYYPDCTVLFCDLVGFSDWSRKRTPSDVFKLLEAVYGAFDRLAKQRNVFKLESVGDSYVAVTGLPIPQQDHAVIMVRFANDCMIELGNMMHVLVARLGDDTAALTMRFGIHSGPVTAGERPIFRLFGTTVNIASKMESSGETGRIQISQATAELLIRSGMRPWVTPRQDTVESQGQKIQTYWIVKAHVSSSINYPRSSRTSVDDDDGAAALSPSPVSLARSANGATATVRRNTQRSAIDAAQDDAVSIAPNELQDLGNDKNVSNGGPNNAMICPRMQHEDGFCGKELAINRMQVSQLSLGWSNYERDSVTDFSYSEYNNFLPIEEAPEEEEEEEDEIVRVSRQMHTNYKRLMEQFRVETEAETYEM